MLFYYAVANASAWTLTAEDRRWPRALTVAGVAGCVGLGAALPAASIVGGSVLLLTGAAVWLVRHRRGGDTPADRVRVPKRPG